MSIALIHGLGGSPVVWSKITPDLPDALTLRLRGAASINAESQQIGATLDRRDGPFTLVGHSMGGLVATAIAEQFPHLVESIILVNTPPTIASRISARGSERVLGLPVIGRAVWNAMPESVVRKGLSSAFAPGFEVPDVFIRDLRATGLQAFLRSTHAIDAYLAERTLPDRLAALACPAHVVFGLRDQRVASSAVDDYQRIPHMLVTTLPASGHTPPWEQPAAVTAAILRGMSPAPEAAL
ncbi:alpha/beta hydrolase [Mycobacterium sp. CBMA 234]|uniref:alpha/beta fold hydrolase n=1 Tax=Mycolicibacterium sp. CBMA 234 TaxID=1918495 RepID=UPI0012DE409A|nr:alpha/beta hydrolase [Mycolicibacterium sp. CBMA 234]MUL62978.1 alpha/beta hydrolase [Mycolicibacterium sp. CBMA 234]